MIAIVGMAFRLPQAQTEDQLWSRLRVGADLITRFCKAELEEAGIHNLPQRYIPARGILEDIDRFDAELFGFTPYEARLLDPQQRLFLECAFAALEDAGFAPRALEMPVGVYVGARNPSYQRACEVPESLESALLSENQFLPLRTSNTLSLSGPSMLISTACSSSLVAVHQASQALLSQEIDLAIVGGTAISIPQTSGYVHQPGGILSSDGRCRSFDARADGTVPGNGVAVMALRRLEDATRDRDPVRAVLRGSAVNNDAGKSASFTAPSIEGQARVITEALAVADVDPSALGYVEAHGSGTHLGDAVEITALGEALRFCEGERKAPCFIGSIKSNIGHLDAAAGIAGLVKAVLCLQRGALVPTAHFETPNSELLRFEELKVSDQVRPAPQLFGVSSFGLGGTNAHVVLEAAPKGERARKRGWSVLTFSAGSLPMLEATGVDLREALASNPGELSDVAQTLNLGRTPRSYRRALLAQSAEMAIERLKKRQHAWTNIAVPSSVCLLFSGLGGQRPGIGSGLYKHFPVFAEAIDEAAVILSAELKKTVHILEPEGVALQPAMVAFQLALLRLWLSLGLEPALCLGYSLGELTALCASGILNFEDTLRLSARRAELIERAAPGAMLTVALPEDALTLPPTVDIAGINDRGLTVIAGPRDDIVALAAQLTAEGIATFGINTDRAVHSRMMAPLRAHLEGLTFRTAPPTRPALSTCTAKPLSHEGLAVHLGRHLVEPVRFTESLTQLTNSQDLSNPVVLELGPGPSFASLAALHPGIEAERAVASLQGPRDERSEPEQLLDTLARLWTLGAELNWPKVPSVGRVHLPASRLERGRYWLTARAPRPAQEAAPSQEKVDVEQTLYRLWTESFGQDVPKDARFLDLGGHSLMALQLLQKIERKLNVQLSVREFFEAQTIGALTKRIHESPSSAPAVKDAEAWVSSLVSKRDDQLNDEQLEALIPEFILSAKRDFNLIIHPHELGPHRTREALARFIEDAKAEVARPAFSAGRAKVQEEIQRAIDPISTPRPTFKGPVRAKNPSATFILSTGRSGSTLLRVMLAGHPALFCPPELHLLPYTSLGDRRARVPSEHFERGLSRTVMALRNITMPKARALVETWVLENLEIQEVFARLQTLARPAHLVDKSPSSLNRMRTLLRAESMFENARYIHLIRHPLAVIESYVRNRFHKIRGRAGLSPTDQAELDWTVTNQHALHFRTLIPEDRWHEVRYESLVTAPEATLLGITRFMKFDFDPAVLSPFAGGRMTDGAGDPGFASRDKIDPRLARAHERVKLPRPLTEVTLQAARQLGYEV